LSRTGSTAPPPAGITSATPTAARESHALSSVA
jgi:hypothetical protein